MGPEGSYKLFLSPHAVPVSVLLKNATLSYLVNLTLPRQWVHCSEHAQHGVMFLPIHSAPFDIYNTVKPGKDRHLHSAQAHGLSQYARD